MISTIILSWNRADLLKRTVSSFLETADAGRELFIVDNASTDNSSEYLRELYESGIAHVIFLPRNEGGLALNYAIAKASGDLIHLSENDQEFFPGWVDHVGMAFSKFPDLGQLSLHGVVPTDDEAWEPKPSRLLFSGGKIIYETDLNVGTSSVLRAELFKKNGIKIKNIESHDFLFPDDGKLSEDVRKNGFRVAWSDRYYVRNIGHEVSEFERNPQYYTRNYASKSRLGVDGWHERVEKAKELPRPRRASVSIQGRPVVPEKTLEPVGGYPSRLWSMFDGWSAEVEVLDFLYALTRLIKPRDVIETGTWLGLAASAIGRALIENGFGNLTTLEINHEAHESALSNLEASETSQVVRALLEPSLEYEPDRMFDMALFDSETHLRINEFWRFKDFLRDGATVVFHDTAQHHRVVIDGVNKLMEEGHIIGLNFPTPRGLFVGQILPPPATNIQEARSRGWRDLLRLRSR